MAENMIKEKLDPDQIRKGLEKSQEEFIRAYILNNFAYKIQPLNESLDRLEADIIRYALLISEENQKKAAYLLGIKPPTLCEKMKRFNIKLDSSLRQTALPFLRSIEEIGRLVSPPGEEEEQD